MEVQKYSGNYALFNIGQPYLMRQLYIIWRSFKANGMGWRKLNWPWGLAPARNDSDLSHPH